MLYSLAFLFIFPSLHKVQGLCGSNIRWSHNLDIDDVYGLWYGVGYAQHTPDIQTYKPGQIGCVTLYITDATAEVNNDWLVWSPHQRNHSDQNWLSPHSNLWSSTPGTTGSWLDFRLKRAVSRTKRSYDERPLRVMWDEDGQTMEQNYVYSPDAPGFWTAEQRGADVWYPDDPPRHPQIIRVLKLTPEMLIINHCSEAAGGVFSLILRRSPSQIDRWEWHDYRRHFLSFDLPNVYRHASVCAGCTHAASVYLVASIVMFKLL